LNLFGDSMDVGLKSFHCRRIGLCAAEGGLHDSSDEAQRQVRNGQGTWNGGGDENHWPHQYVTAQG
jgi:hypothetical protein